MRSLLGVALAISVLGNAFFAYRLLDMGVTTTHQADHMQYKINQLAVMEKMFPILLPNTSRAGLLGAARRAGLETIEKGDGSIIVGNVEFVLSANEVTAVRFE